MQGIPDLLAGRETIAAVIWFMIGFGAGLAVVRLWKYVLIALVTAFLAPFVLSAFFGASLPFTPENVLNAVVKALDFLASFIASNRYSVLGFLLGAVVAAVVSLSGLFRR
ncbi:MAG: hypothetical protein QXK69_12945 [Candidatus Caldarchaeum sp.]